MNPIILIPARLAATRLPDKPLADIHGKPMIAHVWERAMQAGIGPVWVATDSLEIKQAVEQAGGQAVMTRADHPSGSDRIFEALQLIDPRAQHDVVVNVQGDVPTIDPATIAAVLSPLADSEVDIATLAAPIIRMEEKTDPSVVKAVLSFPGAGQEAVAGGHRTPQEAAPALSTPHRAGQEAVAGGHRIIARALYFTRATAPYGEGALYHHIGIYAYRRAALEHFVTLPPSALEQREKLEQLRALEAGMRIDIAVVGDVPLGVDTPAHLARAREILGSGNKKNGEMRK